MLKWYYVGYVGYIELIFSFNVASKEFKITRYLYFRPHSFAEYTAKFLEHLSPSANTI